MSAEEAIKSYGDVVAKLKDVETEFQALTGKLDAMEGQTSTLKAKGEACENEEKAVYDSYFLGKTTEKDLEAIRKKTQNARDVISGHSKMLESLNRCITSKEREIAGLRKQVDLLRHQVWSSLFEAKAAEIPESVRATVKEMVTIGLNCSMGRDFILPRLFPLPNSGEIQIIYKRLSEELNIE